MTLHAPAFLLLLAACAAARTPAGIQTTVCEIARTPDTFNGKLVTISASARPGAHYEIFLFGSPCDQTVELIIPDRLSNERLVESLRAAVFKDFPRSIESEHAITTLTGVLEVASRGVPFRRLHLKKIEAVAVPR